MTRTIDFKKYSSIKIGQEEEVLVIDENSTNLEEYTLIGGCNNTLISPNPPKLMMLSKKYDFIKIEDNLLKIGGATPSGKIASFCKKHNIANFEFLSHLPGKLGGLVFMNAGLKESEIFEHLVYVQTSLGYYEKKDIAFEYRKTDIKGIIFEVGFELSYGFDKQRVEYFASLRKNQPSTPSAGSCFKNPKGDYAGRLIEAVGLKGMSVGGMEFSQQHANFLVNVQDGVYEDAMFLIEEAQKRVFNKFGIKLECEVKILDEVKT